MSVSPSRSPRRRPLERVHRVEIILIPDGLNALVDFLLTGGVFVWTEESKLPHPVDNPLRNQDGNSTNSNNRGFGSKSRFPVDKHRFEALPRLYRGLSNLNPVAVQVFDGKRLMVMLL